MSSIAPILKSSSLISWNAICSELSTTSPHTIELLVAINNSESLLIALEVDPVSNAINRDKTITQCKFSNPAKYLPRSIFRYDKLLEERYYYLIRVISLRIYADPPG